MKKLSGRARRCRSGGWSATPGPRRRWTSAAGRRSSAPDGKRRGTWVFRIVLSPQPQGLQRGGAHGRPPMSSCAAWRTPSPTSAACRRTLVIDNLRAAVTQADWFDPELCPKVRVVRRALRHRDPAHQAVHAAAQGEDRTRHRLRQRATPSRARRFTSLAEQNRHLLHWEATVADTRIHGTTRQQVGKLFEQVEKPALLPLPAGAVRAVPRGAAARCIATGMCRSRARTTRCRRSTWARSCGRGGTGGSVRLFDQQDAADRRACAAGSRAASPRTTPTSCRRRSAASSGERRWLLEQVRAHRPARIGVGGRRCSRSRGIEGVRVLMGLLSLGEQALRGLRSSEACRIANGHGAYHLRSLRQADRAAARRAAVAAELRVHHRASDHPARGGLRAVGAGRT